MRALPVIFIFTSAMGMAQPRGEMQRQLVEFYNAKVPGRVHLAFTQPCYAPGDTAFFAAYFLAAHSMQPIPGQQILDLELFAETGSVIHSQRFQISNGRGFNQVVLGDSLAAGNYRVRCRNEWMKNESDQTYFEAILPVVTQVTSQSTPPITLRATPEGHAFVVGVSNRIHIHYKPNQTGHIYEGNTRLLPFSTNAAGRSAITLIPKERVAYSIRIDNQQLILNAPQKEGLAVLLINPEETSQPLRLKIEAPEDSPSRTRSISVVITQKLLTLFEADLSLRSSRVAVIPIPQDSFPRGLCNLFLYQDGRVLAQRMFFAKGKKPVADITWKNSRVNPRSPITGTIQVKDSEGRPVRAFLTAKIIKQELFGSQQFLPPALEQSLLNQDLRAGSHATSLLSATWNDLDADMAVSRPSGWIPFAASTPNHHPLVRDLVLKASVMDAATGTPVPASTRVTFYLSKRRDVYEMLVNQHGYVEEALPFFFFGEEEVFAKANGFKELRVIADSVLRAVPWNSKTLDVASPYFSYTRLRSAVQASYVESIALRTREKPEFSNYWALQPDEEVKLDEYELFPTMSETLREIVPLLQHRVINGKDEVRLYLAEQVRSPQPLFIIDDVVCEDADFFLGLDPTLIESVGVVHTLEKLKRLGEFGKDGVVIVKTRVPNFSDRVPRTGYFSLPGLTRPITYQPVRTITNTRIPQLSPLLHWAPHLETDKNGKVELNFIGSDELGKFVMLVEGITESGEVIEAMSSLTIEPGK